MRKKIAPKLVNSAAKWIDDEIKVWKMEKIVDTVPVLIVDALYATVREGIEVKSMGALNALGILWDG